MSAGVTTYCALVKYALHDEPGKQRHDIEADLEILGGRLVDEFGFSVEEVEGLAELMVLSAEEAAEEAGGS